MTLNEKMLEAIIVNVDLDYYGSKVINQDKAANECEAIAEDFAEGFNVWYLEKDYWQVTDPDSDEFLRWYNEDIEISLTTNQLITL